MNPALSKVVRDTRAVLDGAFSWDAGNDVAPWTMAATALGVGVPVLIGGLIGQPLAGLAASVGGMWAASATHTGSIVERVRMSRDLVVAAIAAAIAAAPIAQHGIWSDAALVLIAGAAALLGGFSRPAAVASQRFIVFATIAAGMAPDAQDRLALAVLIALGAIWAALCALAIEMAVPHRGTGRASPVDLRSTAPLAQRGRRWRRTLGTRAGWAYPLRLTAGLAGAGLLREALPDHHYSWIAVAVALLTQRQSEGLVVKVTQRAFGVAAGIVAVELIAASVLPGGTLVAVAGILAALRPWLRRRNYAAYTAASTPLIMLFASGGETIGEGLLLDRLIATLIAGMLVIGSWLAARRCLATPPAFGVT